MSAKRLTVERFIAAIKGSKGIKATICRRVPCDHATLDTWMDRHPTMLRAYEDECGAMLDTAHSVVAGNIEAARKKQEADPTKPVDSTDAKWYLARKGRHEGFGTDPAIVVEQQVITLADFRRDEAKRLAEIEEL